MDCSSRTVPKSEDKDKIQVTTYRVASRRMEVIEKSEMRGICIFDTSKDAVYKTQHATVDTVLHNTNAYKEISKFEGQLPSSNAFLIRARC